MRRTAFIILGIAGGIVALVLIGVAIAVATIDVNDFIAPLQAQVKRSTGRDLKVDGRADLKLSLEPKLVVDGASLGNAEWAKGPSLISAKRIEAQVALLPLLKRHFEIVQLTLIDPVISLQTDANGRGNWELGAGGASSDPTERAADAVAPAFVVGDVEIRNGTLTYQDAAAATPRTIHIDTLVLHARSGPINATFKGNVDGVPVAVNMELGPLDALLARQFPYPISIKGEVAGRDTSVATKLTQAEGATRFDDLVIALGKTNLRGRIESRRQDGHTYYTVELSAGTLALEDLALPAAAALSTPSSAASSSFAIPDAKIPFDALAKANGEGHFAVDTLLLRNGQKIGRLDVRFTLRDGTLDAIVAPAVALGGSVRGHIVLAAEAGGASRIRIDAQGRDLALGDVLALAGTRREVQGGKTRVSLELNGRGRSPHEWASTASGLALIVVGPAQVPRVKQPPDSALSELSRAVNPFREVDASTQLECAVVRLPLSGGVAHVDQSIAVQTSKLAATASGTVDFAHETLDLSVHPQIRQGVPIEIPQIADLVRFSGPFRSPKVTIDSMRAAATVARIGIAVATGGWSLLGEGLLAAGSERAPCAIALGNAASKLRAPSQETNPQSGAPALPQAIDKMVPQEIGKALGKIFR